LVWTSLPLAARCSDKKEDAVKTQAKLLEKYMPSALAGRVEWIGLRPARKQTMTVVDSAMAISGAGLEGDHKSARNNGSSRQLTLINEEDIGAMRGLLALDAIDPGLLRRNIVVSGMNLHAFRYQRLRIGEAVIEIRAHCHPCVRMEKTFGAGGVIAMYGHAGYCAVIEQGGRISVGDKVERIGQDTLFN